jgi:hypothetical protein
MDGSQMDEFTRLCKLNDLILRQLVIEHSDTLFEAMSQAMIQHGQGEAESAEAAEAKAELAADPRGCGFIALKGRRGGSALAAAAVNALAAGLPGE